MRSMLICALLGATMLAAGAYVARLQATPAAGFTSTTIALGRFGDIDASNHRFLTAPPGRRAGELWFSLQKTKGSSDLYVQSNVWTPGGTSGWHTHPGHSLIIVTAGEVTAYAGDDPSCTPQVYSAGQGFVDEGGDHVHLIRNEGAVEARSITVQLLPAGAARRIDAQANSACPF